MSVKEISDKLAEFEKNNLVTIHHDHTVSLTQLGRKALKVVFTGGVYDLLHVGHLNTLKEAANFGNFLVVVIARDETVKKRKRAPIHSDIERTRMLNALTIVDLAILGSKTDHYDTVQQIYPDVIAIGADQDHKIKIIQSKLLKRGLGEIKIVRLTADLEDKSTSALIDHIINKHNNHE